MGNVELKIVLKILFHYPPAFTSMSSYMYDRKSLSKKFSYQNEAYSKCPPHPPILSINFVLIFLSSYFHMRQHVVLIQ